MRARGEYLCLGSTRDDAAGEAYDKAAKLLGLGYPGGPQIERMAHGGDEKAFDLPVGLKSSGVVEFSFSGVKTALRSVVQSLMGEGPAKGKLPVPDLCASFQKAITESLLVKLRLAVEQTGVRRVAISGGVTQYYLTGRDHSGAHRDRTRSAAKQARLSAALRRRPARPPS